MRRTTTLLTAACLLTGAAVGCSKSGDEKAADCAAALTERTGGDSADKPTVSEAKERVDALDKTLADLVRSEYASVAKDAADRLEKKTVEGGKSRPDGCEELSKDDYTVLLMAKAIDGLGWTDKDGQFNKLKMVEGLHD
ncbi:hypothetical protein [Streptomyces canus]|uniref:hypothetical protein n=1 Tax=Streptomyces canus TaxID=58343 RepID=UPI002DDB5341|nr:hypothetical protein [Streptomyces canus]WSD82965.1 hypothetical protein OG925_00705 [Streptomyces canus]WSD91868.1 hypothetical protein OG925_49775 [Streptomyces canus]WSD92641.1 hypothetical protein OG925_51185 [Streptomyces canus]